MNFIYDQLRLLEAYKEATYSPDPMTQNGAVIYAHYEDEPVGRGCNSFPRRVNRDMERLERPAKYMYLEHAERNAIYDAAYEGKKLSGSTMYCPWFACTDCARAIIQSGITRVVGHKLMFENTPDHWKESIAIAFDMLKEANIQTDIIDLKFDSTRFNGREWNPIYGYTD